MYPEPTRNLLHSDRGPFVIVVNHQHSIDVLFLLEIWPEIERATTLAKKASSKILPNWHYSGHFAALQSFFFDMV